MNAKQRTKETLPTGNEGAQGAPSLPSSPTANQPVDGGRAAPPPSEQPPKAQRSRGGAPLGNRNALAHGLDSHRLILGKLSRRKRPGESEAETFARRSLAKVEQDAAEFRATLEMLVVEVHGSISLTLACRISSASRWERHAMLATRWLRERHHEMDDSQRLAYSREIARASAERDKAIAALCLEQTATDAWDAYYSGREATLPASCATPQAVAGTSGQQAGKNAAGEALERLTGDCLD